MYIKANRMGMRYPKYVFLTYGTYEPQWWMSQGNHSEDECTSDDLAHTLQYSLAVSHFNTSMFNSILYHACHDAVYSLAYALKRLIQNGSSDAMSLIVGDKTRSQCRYSSSISLLINEQLRYTNFTGNSVSIINLLLIWLCMRGLYHPPRPIPISAFLKFLINLFLLLYYIDDVW